MTTKARFKLAVDVGDDVYQIVPDGLFGEGKKLVSARFRARLDVNEDPDDVYRVRVGARQQIVVAVTPEDDVRAALLDPATRTVEAVRRRELAVADRPGKAVERLVYANRARRPAVVAVTLLAVGWPGVVGAAVSGPPSL